MRNRGLGQGNGNEGTWEWEWGAEEWEWGAEEWEWGQMNGGWGMENRREGIFMASKELPIQFPHCHTYVILSLVALQWVEKTDHLAF